MKESISYIRLLIFQTILLFLSLLFISINNFCEIKKLILAFIIIFCCAIMEKLIKQIEKNKLVKKEKYRKRLSLKEEKYIDDAIELIKTVNSNIEIPKFDIYKIKLNFILLNTPAFTVVNKRNECTIYIKENLFSENNKTKIFMIILHEVLHVMHPTDNVFTSEFLEGLNQYLTIWLIKTYSRKYDIEKQKNLIERYYFNQVTLVANILKKANIENYSVFMNYIKGELGRQFFYEVVKVPKEYLN